MGEINKIVGRKNKIVVYVSERIEIDEVLLYMYCSAVFSPRFVEKEWEQIAQLPNVDTPWFRPTQSGFGALYEYEEFNVALFSSAWTYNFQIWSTCGTWIGERVCQFWSR